ncbi:MAG: manganese catalase family protein [Syntrophomonadaceae bacterium]|nr:manganese catalase family protein [Syntrophomonadaceae bacterium]
MNYVVQRGDTMLSIAKKHGLDLNQLIMANPQLIDPTVIYPGQIIIIPLPEESKKSSYQPHGPNKLPEVDEPYPEIRVERPNPYYAHLLMDNYAGVISEFTAINQYLYHYFDMKTKPGWDEVAELEEAISIVEMRHMEILAKLIFLLGGHPVYQDSCGAYWCGHNVAYLTSDPCAQLQADIQAEYQAIVLYQKRIYEINDRFVKANLARIIKDEELHLQLFTEAHTRHCAKG